MSFTAYGPVLTDDEKNEKLIVPDKINISAQKLQMSPASGPNLTSKPQTTDFKKRWSCFGEMCLVNN